MRSVYIPTALILLLAAFFAPHAFGDGRPFDGKSFHGRIAYSADGNFNDPDDWIASPVALAILAECGAKDRLVHFDYNNILPETDPKWEKIHAESVLGAAKRYGYDLARFHDCRQDREGALASIARAIDASSADDPLYFILAGPMEVPFLGIQRSDPRKREFVYCISHSRWNDGFSSQARHDFFTYNKRSVNESGVHWVQIQDQNRLLSFGQYGKPAAPEEFRPYFWLRDSNADNLRFLWDRMVVSTRPDPSDAGMAYFLMTGDEQSDPAKLQRLLSDKIVPTPIARRQHVRLEAEDFRFLEGYRLEDRNDRGASHRLNVAPSGDAPSGLIRTRLQQPYAAAEGRYDVELRCLDEKRPYRLVLLVGDVPQGTAVESPGEGRGWTTHTIRDVTIRTGDEIAVAIQGSARLDYVQLNLRAANQTGNERAPSRPAVSHPRFTAQGPLDDPAALPGQIIVAGGRPGYLKINGGRPVYLCGPDNPEEFLFLGELNDDGTRSGPQMEIINAIGKSGANAFHFMMFRMRRCNIKDEGDDTHCPFIDFDPAKPLNEKVLDQWDGWLSELEARGVIVHLEFYNDATDVERMGWTLDSQGNLHPDEERWIAGIVQRFKHHKNILWGIEESCNKLPRAWVPHFKRIARLIAETDNHNHPIVQSFVTSDTAERDRHPDGVMSGDYRDDPHIDIITWLHVAPHGEDVEAQHQEYLKWSRWDSDRFIVMKNETEWHRIDRTTARRQTWGCVLAGVHCLEAQHNATRRDGLERIVDDGKVVAFMEQTDWHTMKPRDDLAAGATKWVLANEGSSYIAYTYDCSSPMGLKAMAEGTYDLLWFDTVSGRSLTQAGVTVSSGDAAWAKPEGLGSEIALYVGRSASGSGN